jgi:uncharacterized LabA/DUF88 family protein
MDNLGTTNLALFIDFENLAIGAEQSGYKKFEIALVLKRLRELGRLLYKRAYSDWSSFDHYRLEFHAAAIEMFEIPQRHQGGKNSADIKMVVDALDLCYTRPHLDTFVLASGDSDFTPLVAKLREYNKRVIGIGVKNSTSNLLVDTCDQFIFYEDLKRGQGSPRRYKGSDKKKTEVFGLLTDAVKALQRQNREIMWGSLVKQTMNRLQPTFDLEYFGFRNFTQLLEQADKEHIVSIERDDKSGSYIVLDVGSYQGLEGR